MTNQKRAFIPGTVYTSVPAYLPDPLSDFSKGLVPRLDKGGLTKSREAG